MARLLPGQAYPLGAICTSDGINFALFSANATAVELCLFSADGEHEVCRYEMPACSDDIWHGFLPDAKAGQLYGYRVYGPYEPLAGHRFNHHKLLIDPYARALAGELKWTDANYGFIRGHADADLSFDTRDNAQYIPKCVVTPCLAPIPPDSKPTTPMLDTIVYEAHVKGFTKRLTRIKPERRGTYLGLASDVAIRHIKSLGVTAVELLPVQGFVDDHFLIEQNLVNYWGYNTLTFMAPAARYAASDAVEEFRRMTRKLHRAGLEVWLDVVYNHTCEGNELGPTLSFRGIDNASYYRLAKNPRNYLNDSGTGNTLDLTHPRVLQLVMDSLRYWVSVMGVDGFRFDLASILGREDHGFDRGAGFFDAVKQDPTLTPVKLIAEPWDIGPGGYQLGNYPVGWSEWNDQYRDVLRQFWRGDHGMVPKLAKRLLGSSEQFEWQRRGPAASLNFLTAHDGFTLNDLVSYAKKHNQANLEDNRDGHDSNYSANFGVEGDTADAEINVARQRRQRAMLASLFVSHGVPMLLAGDELSHSQEGNNNAYCQDNSLTWIDWREAQSNSQLHEFVIQLIALRRTQPVLRAARHLHGAQVSAVSALPDVSWLNETGEIMQAPDWHDVSRQHVGLLLANTDNNLSAIAADTLLILFNASEKDISYKLNLPGAAHMAFSMLLNSAYPERTQQGPVALTTDNVISNSQSVIVLRCYTPL